jgi:hypothetical protein
MTRTWEQLAALKCRTCQGTRCVDGDIRNDEDFMPCTDCLQGGKPTGLLLPELSRQCRHGIYGWRDCLTCDRTPAIRLEALRQAINALLEVK